MPLVLGCSLAKGRSHESGATLLLWPLALDPFKRCRTALGALEAKPNLQNPFHHIFVYPKVKAAR